jgi:hypothetical protein
MKNIHAILLLLLITSCQGQKKEQCLIELEKKITPQINQEIIKGEIINFRDNVNCIEWDSLVIVMAGKKELIEKNSHIEIPYQLDIDYFQYNDHDGFIFFLKNNKAVAHIHFVSACRKNEKCKTFDFFTLQKNNLNAFVAKSDAVFEVYTDTINDNQGNSWKKDNAIRLKGIVR